MSRKSVLPVVFLSLLVGYLLGGRTAETVSAITRETYDNVELFANVLTIVRQNYVDEVSTHDLIEGAINGMLSSLDPHSAYLTPDFYRELQVDTRGQFGGLGIEITIRNGVLTIVAPIEDTPAYRAGLQAGDQIIKIEDDFTKDMTLIEAVRRMRGPKGTKITITIRREGVPELFDVTLVREIIKIRSVKSRLLEKGYGYLRVVQFQERTADDLRKALEKLEKENGGPLDGLVLDLRNNPGGLLSQAVQVADVFLDTGLIVYTEGRHENQKNKYFAHKAESYVDTPMVVLVNGGSASASEIVAGALQDHKRALVLGTPTFGKGSVQTILPLDDQSAIRLTTARYYTPNGRSIQATGITPDIYMENVVVTAQGRPESPMVREENLPGHFEQEEGEEAFSPEEGEKNDAQLQRALELLKSWNVFKSVAAS
ncbi:MAG: peptidase S41 [Candidatus Binatia bacterium]|nr:MAG: peptidase S41 [Candidatus Binatia bacterium]